MRKVLVVCFVMFYLVVAGPAIAGKIGFVDAERAVVQVKEGAAKILQLEAWALPKRQELEAAAARVAELREQIGKQRAVASRETLERMQQDEIDARRAFEDGKRDFERELAAKQDEFLSDVAVKVGAVASDYAEANGFDAVFVLKAQPLIYISDSADLTETIIRLYNQRFPAGS